MNARAARDFPNLPLNEAIRRVTEVTDRQFHEDVDALGALRPSVEPRATEHIAEMRALIEKLVAGGFAYVAEEHVLFSPQAMNAANAILPRYGALAKRSLDEMIAGARVDVAPYKRDPADFVLWKPSKPGEPSWSSPAGIKAEGRPGWHIECSAMAWKHLGETFDIHGGGIDLVFPHHENELAQTCCAFHASRMANVWMHNGFLQVESEKMSKSLGNFITIRELLGQRPSNPRWGEILRFNMLRTHYRQPIDWTEAGLLESEISYGKLRQAASGANRLRIKPSEGVLEALADDLNTSEVMAELHRLANAARSTSPSDLPVDAANELAGSLQLLGFEKSIDHIRSDDIRGDIQRTYQEVAARERGLDPKHLDELLVSRTAARSRKDFKESDRIRDELAAMGIVLKDGKDAEGKPMTTWEVAR
ncbi:cysteine--tRNA ligase [Bradyrhizobium sp.]|uniref:cysteine--tRNA ligase n=1 Tax=Bradyrhizobium sp. TaxID=376 RepID=UPI003F8D3C6A